jgi:UDP-glucose 6-dehydrogenase
MEIVVVGIGHVGLVAACCLANSGHQVTGVEIDKAKLELLSSGISPIYERGIEELLRSGLSSRRLAFSQTLPAPLKAEVCMSSDPMIQVGCFGNEQLGMVPASGNRYIGCLS